MTRPDRRPCACLVVDGTFADRVAAALEAGLSAGGWAARRLPAGAGAGADAGGGADLVEVLLGCDATLLLSDRHDWSTLDRFDEASHATRRRWLSVTHRHPFVQVGPYVRPFDGPCHRCLRLRLAQHDRLDPVTERSAAGGPAVRGLAPHLAVTAAGLALALLTRSGSGDRGDEMFLVHVDGLPVTRVPVVAAHLCRRCGEPARRLPLRDARRIRSVLPSVGTPR